MKGFSMEALVLNTKFETVASLDVFKSFVWTDKYNGYGDFEIYISPTSNILPYMAHDNYLILGESEHVMIIESTQTDSQYNETMYFVKKGRSLESILERRIVWFDTVLTGKLQDGIKKLLTDNIISPTDENRKINNFVFEETDDEYIKALEIDARYYGENLYEVVSSLCASHDIGFKITLSEDNKFVFKLYKGVNHSLNQEENDYIEFSPNFDNLTSSNFFESTTTLKTVTLVSADKNIEVKAKGYEEVIGLNRREHFTNASHITQSYYVDGEEYLVPDKEYETELREAGLNELSNNKLTSLLDGSIDTVNPQYVYGEDFFMGDIVQIQNEYGIGSASRITEIIFSQDETGYSISPTFSSIIE